MPRAARTATLLLFAAGLADGVLMPFFALWARSEGGVPVAYVGLLLACYAGGELIATPLVGGIADKLGRRPVLLVSTTGVGVGFLLLYCSHGVIAAALSLLVIGVFESVLHPTAATVVADVVPGPRLREHFALTRVASSAGHAIGPALGAILVQHSLGLVFVGAGVTLLAGAIAAALFLPETRVAGIAAEADDDDFTAIFAVVRDRRLAALLLPLALIGIISSWIETVLPLYAADAGSLTPTEVGLLFTYASLLGVVFQLPLTQLSACIRADRLILASGIGLMLALASLMVSPQLPALVVAVSLAALAEMVAGPVTQALASDLAPASARATYMAAYSAVHDVRDTAGPAIGTSLYAASASLPWFVGVPIALVGTLLLARTARNAIAVLPVPTT